MSTFDSSQYDVPTLVGKLQDQRFDGFDPESLAREVTRFRDGGGTAAMGDAVDALKQVAATLMGTDSALREQLAALGVSWESEAGGQASTVLTQQAGFSENANAKVGQAAQLIFQQGEAFNRTKNKLPDPEALRKGEDGYTMSDTIFSLFGFETDHSADVRAGAEAKAQAIDALNAYAHDSGNYLSASEPVDAPQSMDLMSSPGAAVQSVAGPTITPVPPVPDVPDVPDTSPTVAAGAKDAPVVSPPVVHTPATPPTAPPAAPVVAPVVNAPPAQGGTVPSNATPPAQAPSAPAAGPVTGVGGVPGRTGGQQPGSRHGGSTFVPGGTGGTEGNPGYVGVPGSGGQDSHGGTAGRGGLAGGPGTSSGHGPGSSGGGPGGEKTSGGVIGKGGPGGPGEGLPGGRGGGGEALLGKGKTVGSIPGATSGATNVGPGYPGVRAAGGTSALAEGAPAVAAAAGAGATSGDQERERRRPGTRDARKPVNRLPMGDLPEEEEALRAKKAAPEPPSRERTRSILEPAATQDGEEGGAHVRRFGVDDRDLFTDPREVSPDLIGDKRLPEE